MKKTIREVRVESGQQILDIQYLDGSNDQEIQISGEAGEVSFERADIPELIGILNDFS